MEPSDNVDQPLQASRPAAGGIAPLTAEEARVLGCLVEKESTTPEYYPLTLNAVVTACNQSSNRDPVVSYSEATVQQALETLKALQFVFQVTLAGARTQKFKHNLTGKFPRLDKAGLALMCTLLLRGPQTAGELRQRTERLFAFDDLAAVETALQRLIDYPEGPLAVCLPPGGGRRVAAFAHLLCGEAALATASTPAAVTVAAPSVEIVEPGWRDKIEAELAALREQVAELKARLDSVL